MDQTAEKIVCRQCYFVLDAGDNFCRQCGLATPQMAARLGQTGVPMAAVVGSKPAFWESPWVILPMLLLIAGPLALPMLWRSRRFSRLWKIALSVFVTGITLWVFWLIWQLLNQDLASLNKLLSS
jgi:hypothetical protein